MKVSKFFTTTLIILAISGFTKLSAQTNNDACELVFYRPAQSMMSGGAGAELKIYINDQEVGMLPNGTVLKYTVYSQGNLKIKFVGIIMNTTAGQPMVVNVEAKHGETIEINTSVNFPGGANAKILATPKEKEKLKKVKWADLMEGKENMETPFIPVEN